MKTNHLLLVIFSLFVLFSCETKQETKFKKENKKPFIIALQPFTDTDIAKTKLIQQTIADFYHYKPMILPAIKPPKTAFINIKTPRYRADSLLLFLWKSYPDSISHIIGIASFDISTIDKFTLKLVKIVHNSKRI